MKTLNFTSLQKRFTSGIFQFGMNGLKSVICPDRVNKNHFLIAIFSVLAFCGNQHATAQTVTKPLYLSENQDLDRIDPVSTADATTSNTYVMSVLPAGVVAVNTTTNSSANPNSTTFTVSNHTVSNGLNRMLLVGISQKNKTVTSVTYAGQSMTLVGEWLTGTAARVHVYRLMDPPVGTGDVVVTLGANPDKGIIVGATTFTGVNQTTPLGTWTAANATSNTATTSHRTGR